jgi:hypothetical protein
MARAEKDIDTFTIPKGAQAAGVSTQAGSVPDDRCLVNPAVLYRNHP